jgi:hypothetical protein
MIDRAVTLGRILTTRILRFEWRGMWVPGRCPSGVQFVELTARLS